MTRGCISICALALAMVPAFAQGPQAAVEAPMPQILQKYQPVTAERLKHPEDGNWLMIRRTYDGWGYSPLDQLTPANVAQLKPVWIFSTGETRAHESAPIVNNGVMFVTTPMNQVIAIDAKTGTLLWRYRRKRPDGATVPHEANRGIALFGDKVYFAAGEAVLVALDAKTGKEVWTTEVADNRSTYYMTLAPLVAGGAVMVGVSGGEFGVRGFVAAFDTETGKELWKTYTVPAPGEPGSETWPKGDEWKTGGAPVWVTGNYDPETNLAYFGTGNGGPTVGDNRPGDNLYTSSTIALDVATGAMKGYFQYHPNDSWDYDEVSPPLLLDYQRNGRTVHGLVDVARDGYVWFLDRGSLADSKPHIGFIEAKPYVYQNTFKSIDPVSGRPDVDPEHKPGTGKRADFCPGSHGGKTWPPIAFSPKTRMIYIPANNNLCSSNLGVKSEYKAGKPFVGITGSRPFAVPGADHFGEVQAWNVDTGQKVWTHEYAKSPNWGSMLATAGGLVFSGGTVDRMFHAFDATTGKLLWEFPTNSGIEAPPTSFLIDGKQYIAIESGWGGDARGDQNTLNRLFPGEYPEVPEGGVVWVFAVQ
ncbi:MAG TPA: PQQ-dependent dehydrogenase, methanol/ethanol family [Bryobacteraceae bacterium]|nr:PQQ-dependent dehydrogenase, methanol/ethanol family [Bryobacteraceae bacterium]